MKPTTIHDSQLMTFSPDATRPASTYLRAPSDGSAGLGGHR
jgi:hypothetical protein